MIEHPFITDADDKSIDELLDIMGQLNKKLVMASRMNNSQLIAQLHMVIDTYRAAHDKKQSEQWKKESGNISGQIDIQ